jgi:hypothetical protein
MSTGGPPSPEDEEVVEGSEGEPDPAAAGGAGAGARVEAGAGAVGEAGAPEAAVAEARAGEPAAAEPDGPGATGADGPPDGAPAGAGSGTPAPEQPRRANEWWMIVIGTVLLFTFGLALIASLINLWPAIESFTSPAAAKSTTNTAAASLPPAATHYTVRVLLGTVKVKTTSGTSLLLVVVITGALGSAIHMLTSFADFVGNRRLFKSWLAWYLLRPVIGAALAVLMYVALRGGFFSGNLQSGDVNPYGVAALGGLAGLFSQQATDKLKEVFETLFRVSEGAGDAQRKDDLGNPAPVIKKIEPQSVPAGAAAKLKIIGEGFANSSVVHVEGNSQPTTYVSAQLLEVAIPAAPLAQARALNVTVVTPPPGGGESQPLALAVV